MVTDNQEDLGDAGSPPAAAELAAGDLSDWLVRMQGALHGDGSVDVPCGTCTACCTSSQFVHIAPDETDALARIPAALLFPAPGLPRGHVLLGYDEHGRCPMLAAGRCSIYEDRPRTCRTYDCRVFAASGVEVDEQAKSGIAERVRRWRFDMPDPSDARRLAAVRSAAAFVTGHPGLLPEGVAPVTATQLAVLAVEIHDMFLVPPGDADGPSVVEPEPEALRGEVLRRAGRGD